MRCSAELGLLFRPLSDAHRLFPKSKLVGLTARATAIADALA